MQLSVFYFTASFFNIIVELIVINETARANKKFWQFANWSWNDIEGVCNLDHLTWFQGFYGHQLINYKKELHLILDWLMILNVKFVWKIRHLQSDFMCTYIQFDVYLAALQVASYPQYGLSSSSPASGMNCWATLTELHLLIDSVFDTILLWFLKATAHWWNDSLRNIDRNASTDRFSVWHNFTSQRQGHLPDHA